MRVESSAVLIFMSLAHPSAHFVPVGLPLFWRGAHSDIVFVRVFLCVVRLDR